MQLPKLKKPITLVIEIAALQYTANDYWNSQTYISNVILNDKYIELGWLYSSLLDSRDIERKVKIYLTKIYPRLDKRWTYDNDRLRVSVKISSRSFKETRLWKRADDQPS